MTITIDEIKAQHSKVADMIATFEASAKLAAAYPITVAFPKLNAGEIYVGCIISADGKKREHIILLPGALVNSNWADAMEWAASLGGSLPDRCESALLFATMKDQFQTEWHWTREQDAFNGSYAWVQGFSFGYQDYLRKSSEYSARAVRRLSIIE